MESKSDAKANPLSFFNYLKGDALSDSEDENSDKDKPTAEDDHNPFSFKSFDSVSSAPVPEPPLSKSSAKEWPSPPKHAPPKERASPLLPETAAISGLVLPSPEASCLACSQLKKENRRLRTQVQESSETIEKLNKRIVKLQTKLKLREERETAEASQLEEMLRQVEKNLQQSQARAQDAEEKAAKLSREVSHLRAKGRCQEDQARGVEVGTELVETSQNAKQMLRQLLSGVERLSILGQALQSEAKFKEVP